MFEKIFYESEIKDFQQVNKILRFFSESKQIEIENISDLFGRVRKPYLQKRSNLNLFLGRKRGQLVKVAPAAYGKDNQPHYYFIHSYNCIYECSYCYLQGYFNSPDLVFFLNHEEICQEIEKTAQAHSASETVWFHAGEFSDSLALSHLTGELPCLFSSFAKLPNAKLELRTKSANIREILKQNPLDNIITSFSLSPDEKIKKNELKTASLDLRLKALKSLHLAGFKVAIHLDPIIYDPNFLLDYAKLTEQILAHVPAEAIEYVSLGVIRFTKDVYRQVEKNYPQSEILAQSFVKSFDQKMRYDRPTRMFILKQVRQLLLARGFVQKQIYFCMEDSLN